MDPILRAAWVAADLPDVELVAEHATATERLEGAGRCAVYELLRPDAEFQRLLDQVGKLGGPLAAPPAFVVLTEFSDLHAAVAAEPELRHLPAESLGPVVARSVLMTSSAVSGVRDADFPDLGPIIQLGQFNMPDAADEWDLSVWYEDQRLAPFATMSGGIRARRLAGICGPTKFGVLYEFDSRHTHRDAFVAVLEERAHRNDDEMGGVVRRTLHAAVSPTVGRRITDGASG